MTTTESAGIEALRAGLGLLGLTLDDRAEQRLVDFLGLIVRWNRVHNLTAVRDPAAMVAQHLLDSLAALPPLRRWAASRAGVPAQSSVPEAAAATPPDPLPGAAQGLRLLDVGSGAGLPGAVLAIAEPAWSLTCVDSVAKKAAFIRQVAVELGLKNLLSVHARVESLPPGPGFDVVTSRAFASLADFVAGSGRLPSSTGCWMAMKGRIPEDELAALPSGVEVFHVEPLKVPGLQAQRCLVWMRRSPA